jgi:hypothetical protein
VNLRRCQWHRFLIFGANPVPFSDFSGAFPPKKALLCKAR